MVNPGDGPLPDDALERRRRRLIAAGTVAVVLLIWTLLGVSRLLSARDLALSGLAELESIRGRVDVEAIADGDLITPLVDSWGEFRQASEQIRSPFVTPLRLVPYLRTQVQSAEALSSSASTVTGALAEAATAAANITDIADTMNRATVARETLDIVRRTRASLATTDLGPDGGLIGSLAQARRDFETELRDAEELLANAETAAAGFAEFLEGPTTYLLLAANNAEMRAGSGSYLQVGTVRIVDGRVEVDELRPAGDILVDRGAVSIDDSDLDSLWGWLDMAVDWRNLSASPRFPANAPVAVDMWEAIAAERVDGVMVLDPVGLARLMAVTGAVEVDGRRIDAEAVIRELLFDQYWEDDVAERRDRLEEIARAALDGVEREGIDLITLARELQDAAAARHILAWSSRDAQQAAWEVVGVSGTMRENSLAVAVLNRGANKLDPFLTVDADLTSRPIDAGREITIRLTLDNAAQLVFPSYVLGPAAAFGYEPGTYVGILSVNLPGAADAAAFAGDPPLAAEGPDGPSRVLATAVEVPAGERLEYELTFTLPDGHGTLRLEPSARVPGIEWSALGVQWTDTSAVTLDLAAGSAEGDALGSPEDAVSFELDPIRNPTAPLPAITFNSEVETTVEVQWQPLQDDAAVDVWERVGDGDWSLVATSIRTGPVRLPDRPRTTELCYRTALSIVPEQFGAVECLTIPGSIGYMQFPGDPGTYFAAADFVGSGPLDVRALVAPDRWEPEFWQMIAGQYDSPRNDRAWRFGIDIFGALIANFSPEGRTDLGANSFFPSSFRDGSREWIRVTIDPTAGVQRYWTSENGASWAQLGGDQEFDQASGLHDSGGPVYIGADRRGTDNPFAGKIYYIEIRSGIDGPIVGELDFRSTAQQDGGPGRWIDGAGNVFNAVGDGWIYVPPET